MNLFDDEPFDAYQIALRVMHDWLVKKFNDVDFEELVSEMENDPECVMLLDDDFDKVYDSLLQLKLVNIVLK